LHNHNIVGKFARDRQQIRSNAAGSRLQCKLVLEDLVPSKRDCRAPFGFRTDLQTRAAIATLTAKVMESRV
jgi:hypothetical protein